MRVEFEILNWIMIHWLLVEVFVGIHKRFIACKILRSACRQIVPRWQSLSRLHCLKCVAKKRLKAFLLIQEIFILLKTIVFIITGRALHFKLVIFRFNLAILRNSLNLRRNKNFSNYLVYFEALALLSYFWSNFDFEPVWGVRLF